MPAADIATVQALRSDMALQLARWIKRRGLNQLAAAEQLEIPQPTVSKLLNGRVTELSLELLIRIAVRAGLPLVLQTGYDPEEAGVFVSVPPQMAGPGPRSKLAEHARDSLIESTRQLTPQQRLGAFLEHNQLVAALHDAGRLAEKARLDKSGSGNVMRASTARRSS